MLVELLVITHETHIVKNETLANPKDEKSLDRISDKTESLKTVALRGHKPKIDGRGARQAAADGQ